MGDARSLVEGFVLDTLLLGDGSRLPASNDSLIESGVIDSTGVLELIEYLEQEFDISVDDSETIPQNLDSIDRILEFVARKRS